MELNYILLDLEIIKQLKEDDKLAVVTLPGTKKLYVDTNNRLLSLTSSPLFESENSLKIYNFISKTISVFIVCCLAYGAWHLVKVKMAYPMNISPLIPRWCAQIIMPIGFILIAFHMIQNSYDSLKHKTYLIISIIFLSVFFNFDILRENSALIWIGIFILTLSLFRGAPIFIGLGGLAVFLFWRDWTPLSAISAEAY